MFGALIFLSFVGLATNVLVGLYATSVATSVAWEAARQVASDPSPQAVDLADAAARRRLAAMRNVDLAWQNDSSGAIGLTLSADRPSLLPPALARSTRLTTIDRTVWVRREELR